MKPPAIARALLAAVAGESWAECVAGDLEEEFAERCHARDRAAGARWYLWQVIRSVAPLVRLRLRSGELRQTAAIALASVAVPLLLLDRLWSFVYSQIPLKDGTGRAPEFLAVNVLAVCAGAALAGAAETSPPVAAKASARALAALAAAGFAMWFSVGRAPARYDAVVLIAAPASCLMAFGWRRSR
jgi:hypothetical protein